MYRIVFPLTVVLLVVALALVGCGSTLGSTTTSIAAAVTTATTSAPTTTTAAPTTTTAAATSTTTTVDTSQEKVFVFSLAQDLATFQSLFGNENSPSAIYATLHGLLLKWQDTKAPSDRTAHLLSEWLDILRPMEKGYSQGVSGDSTGAIQTFTGIKDPAGQGTQLGRDLGDVAASLGVYDEMMRTYMTSTTMATTTTEAPTATTLSAFYRKYSGTGSKIVNLGTEPTGNIFILHLTAKKDFEAKCFDSSGSEVLTEPEFSNPDGAYDGRVGATEDTTKFQINTKGAWTLEVLPVSAIRVLAAPGTISGKSDDVIMLTGNPSSLKISGDPKDEFGNFIVDYYAGDQDTSTNLVNELGKYDGVAVVSGNGVLTIESDFPWTITAEQ